MDQLEKIQTYFNASLLQEGMIAFIADLLLTALLSYLLGLVYTKFGKSLSNRKDFASNFILLSLTTMTIITVVKSSLALSLGLVGALSIVRFRAAIKDPEELTFLFAIISLGLGIGAGHRYTMIIAFLVFVCVIAFRGTRKKPTMEGNFFITISCDKAQNIDVDSIVGIVEKHVDRLRFKRFDEASDTTEYIFSAFVSNTNNIDSLRKELKNLNANINLAFMEDNGFANF